MCMSLLFLRPLNVGLELLHERFRQHPHLLRKELLLVKDRLASHSGSEGWRSERHFYSGRVGGGEATSFKRDAGPKHMHGEG